MKVLKSVILVALSVSAFALASCNNNAAPATDNTTNTEAVATEAAAGDCGNCDKAKEGTCEKACDCSVEEGGCKCDANANCGKEGCGHAATEAPASEEAAQ